jgi:branched-chain amino acid transport system substrate-binding protein
MKLRKLAVIGAAGLLAVSAATPVFAQSPAAPSIGTLKVGISLPLSGGARADGGPTEKGVQLAIEQANAAGGIGGYMLEAVSLDHAVAGKYNEVQGAQDMQTFVGDANVIGVVGPYNSAVAKVQIPISNAAGLLQCSPANTNETLTKPPLALDLRKTHPKQISYIRVAATDDIQGPAMADYAYTDLGLRNLAVIDDVTTFGYGVADNFAKRFELLGGKVGYREGATSDTTDFNGIITNFPEDLDGVYYGGVVTSGGGLLLKQMRNQGLTVPFLGPDGIKNGSGADKGSLINIAGAAAANGSYATVATIGDFAAVGLGPRRDEFDTAYKAQFKDAPDFQTPGAYSAAAYACATVILESLKAALDANPADLAAIREGVRAYATDTTHTFDTVLGETSFDQNGDVAQPYISWYQVDPTAQGGVGDWVFIKQQGFGKH